MYPTDTKQLLVHKEFYQLKSAKRNFRDPKSAIDVGQYLKIHSHQLFGKLFISPNTLNRSTHLSHGTGTGKCHGIGTPILMYDGTIKNVEDIVIGDCLMGPYGIIQTVTSTCTGVEELFKISSECGESFVCNRSHVLSLRMKYGSIVNVLLSDIIDQKVDITDCKLWKDECSWISMRKNKLSMDSVAKILVDMDQSCIPLAYKINDHLPYKAFLSSYVNYACEPHAHGARILPKPHLHDLLPDLKFMVRAYGFDIRLFDGEWVIVGNFDHLKCAYKFPSTVDMDTTFTWESLGDGRYYGFTLAPSASWTSGLYMLGNFIVTHNTLAATVIAQEFVAAFKKLYNAKLMDLGNNKFGRSEAESSTPTIFVMGFEGTKAAFYRELLSHPEFGFITVSEAEELARRYRQSSSGIPDDIKSHKDYYTQLKRRITQKSRDGFYKFYGYDKFFNKLFLQSEVDITSIEQNEHMSSTIEGLIKAGKIQINEQFLKQFQDSLIIADEIHNTYNMQSKNLRGIALQYVIDHTNVRLVTLSATPINNSPSEIVELMNYHGCKQTKKALFDGNALRPGALEIIRKCMDGKWSLFQDNSTKYFPRRIFVGEPITLHSNVLTLKAGTQIPYLNFTHCQMSQLHVEAYEKHLREYIEDALSEDEQNGDREFAREDMSELVKIPTDGYSIYDMVLPGPQGPIFRSTHLREIVNASDSWKQKVGVEVKKRSGEHILSGRFLLRENIDKYSTKLSTLLDELEKMWREQSRDLEDGIPITEIGRKVLIYHNRVRMSGVLLIHECLRVNGYLDETMEAIESTLCHCGKRLKDHKKHHTGGDDYNIMDDVRGGGGKSHEFLPIRIAMAHSSMEKSAMEANIARFNSVGNLHGNQALIFIGSKIIKESYDFKAVRAEFILSLPISIPITEQVIGRVSRKNSHAALPEHDRDVRIFILVSVMKNADSPEVIRYAEKMVDYQTTQAILRELNADAVDAQTNRDTIMTPEQMELYFPGLDTTKPEVMAKIKSGKIIPKGTLGNLWFDVDDISYRPDQLKLSTFNAYRHFDDEVKQIIFIIKNLFIVKPAYSYDELWEIVRAPPIGLEVNPELFSEENFLIALHVLTWEHEDAFHEIVGDPDFARTLIERLFDAAERKIRIGLTDFVVTRIGDTYVRAPLSDESSSYMKSDVLETSRHRFATRRIQPKLDAETYSRVLHEKRTILIPVSHFTKASSVDPMIYYERLQNVSIRTYFTFNIQVQILICEYSILNPTKPTAKKVLALLSSLGALVTSQYVAKYKDVARIVKKLPSPTTVVGYLIGRSVRIWTGSEWSEVSKISLNAQSRTVENDIAIGYIENDRDVTKFKLRRPVHEIARVLQEDRKSRAESGIIIVNDTRLIERGIVCDTKPKHDLLMIIKDLGARVTDDKVRSLCKQIKDRLLDLEIDARTRKDKLKYFYGWWDEYIDVALQV